MSIPLKYNLRNLLVRRTTTLATVGGIALVILVIILLLSLLNGLRRLLLDAGSPDTLIVMRKGATSESVSFVQRDQLQALRYLPGISAMPDSTPSVSPELIVQPLLESKTGGREMVVARGVTPMAFHTHKNVSLIAGRVPRPSLGEAAIGISVAGRYKGAALGETLHFGQRDWTVVGLFSAQGTIHESEIWVDIDDLFTDASRANYSTIRLTLADNADRDALIRRIAGDPRIALEAKPETVYYEEQTEGMNGLYILTALLAVIMATGAVFGAMNTMFAEVARRTAEIATLRALGFSRATILTSFVTESVCMAITGYAVGVIFGGSLVVLVNAILKGVAFQLPSFSTVMINLHFSANTLLITFLLAALMGVLGGFLPAWRAAHLGVTEALRRA